MRGSIVNTASVAGLMGAPGLSSYNAAKGGVVLGICDELKVPVRYLGIGETIGDLREFDAKDFVDRYRGKRTK